ncbi:hypothetical protein GCM10023196_066500 [Actinoallomurus vinaceus]|uniref:Lipoprotein n=1 Tax=Actinoallomurus vinaceus TaxID=1080074 RepID=A0ABP8UK63_9ACTN
MRTVRLRFAAFAALTAALCSGCKSDPPDHHSAARPSVTATSPTVRPSVTPHRLSAVLVSARSAAGRTEVTYRPARIKHVRDQYSEYNKVIVTGPQATLELSPDVRIVLMVPLHGMDPNPDRVSTAVFVAALAKNRSYLPNIGFEVQVGADGRVASLQQVYTP